MLFHALPETDPGYLALRALVRVLDDGMSTRLHYQICDQKGLAYSVAGSLHSYHDSALLEVDAACAHAKLPALVTETLAMLGRFRDELVGEDELEKAKLRFVSDVESSYDDSTVCAAGSAAPSCSRAPTPQEKRARALARVRPEDIRESRAACCAPSACRSPSSARSARSCRAGSRRSSADVRLKCGPDRVPLRGFALLWRGYFLAVLIGARR